MRKILILAAIILFAETAAGQEEPIARQDSIAPVEVRADAKIIRRTIMIHEDWPMRIYHLPRVRIGIGYRFSLGMAERGKTGSENPGRNGWQSPGRMSGGDLLLETTVRITGHWHVGAGLGYGFYGDRDYNIFSVYAKAEYHYGKRPSRWFNYVNLGPTFRPNRGTGVTAGLGGGYCFALAHRRIRLDLLAGPEYLTVAGKTHGTHLDRLGILLGSAIHF